MLRDVAAFEWRYHTRQAAFWGASLLFALLGFTLSATGFGPSNVAVNAPWLLMESMGFLSLLAVFASAIFCANAVIRDSEHRMAEIVHTTPIGKLHYLGGRFAGVFLATLTATSFAYIGSIVGMYASALDPERVAAFDPLAYLRAFAILTIPNVLFACAVLFALAATTRNALACYAGAVVLYVLYFVAAALTDSPLMAGSSPGGGGRVGPALLDPIGLTAFFEMTRYWTVVEKNTRGVGLSGLLLANRAIWISATAMIFAATYRAFTFRLIRRKSVPRGAAGSQPAGEEFGGLRARRSTTQRISWLASFRSATKLELRALRSIPFLLLLVLWAALAGTEIYSDIRDVEYGSALYPATGLILTALRQPLAMMGMILIVYYASELFWREQRHRFASIADTTPASPSAMLAAKWSALATLVVAIIAAGLLPGVLLQLATGYLHFQPLTYLAFFWFAGLPLILFAGAALAVNALVPNRYAGMLAVLLVGILSQRGELFGLEHPLFRFAAAPPVRFSDMNGFGHAAAPFHLAMLHWSVVTALLFAFTASVWRAVGRPLRERLRFARLPLVLPVLALATGAWLFYDTNIANEYVTSSELLDWREQFEKKYAHLATLPQPRTAAVDATVDLFPSEQRYRVRGRDTLRNETAKPIATVLVSVPRDARSYSIAIPHARLVANDKRYGFLRFELTPPLAPNATTELHYELAFKNQGDSVVANGSYLVNAEGFPFVGYRRQFTIDDPRERRRRGLPEVAAGVDEQFERARIALTISTSEDQTAIAPGHLARTWTANDRRYFRYESDVPLLNAFAIASARYEVIRRQHRGVTFELWHHHEQNVEAMFTAAMASFDYCSDNYGPYPGKQLRLVEVPSYWNFGAFAMPEVVFLVENRTFLIDTRDPNRPDLLARRIAHEVAHEWWGHRVTPKSGPGASTIVESLTKYTELRVVERLRGAEQVHRMLALEHDRYLAGRSETDKVEVPLTLTEGQPYLYYGKGALVFSAIRDLIGEARLNLALRNFFTEESVHENRATTADLLRHLQRVAPREFPLIREWLSEIVLYDFSVKSAELRGRELIVHVDAHKFAADGKGRETPRAMSEAIEIGAGDQVTKHVLHEGDNTIVIAVEGKPENVEVDPHYLRIDRNRFDNVKRGAAGS